MRRIHPMALAAVAASGLSVSQASAQAPSIWTDVMGKKKLTSCIVPSYQPYSWKDQDGKWQGFVAEMARNVAGATACGSRVRRDLFQNRGSRSAERECDVFFGFNATPERALAIDFAGPLYTLGFIFMNRKWLDTARARLGGLQQARYPDLLSARYQHGAAGKALGIRKRNAHCAGLDR